MKTPRQTSPAKHQPSLKVKIDQMNTWGNFKEWDDIFLENGLSRSESTRIAVKNVLDYLNITETTYPEYLQEKCDFWNDKNQDGHYFCDLVSEWVIAR